MDEATTLIVGVLGAAGTVFTLVYNGCRSDRKDCCDGKDLCEREGRNALQKRAEEAEAWRQRALEERATKETSP